MRLVSYITTLRQCHKCAQVFQNFNINQLKMKRILYFVNFEIKMSLASCLLSQANYLNNIASACINKYNMYMKSKDLIR